MLCLLPLAYRDRKLTSASSPSGFPNNLAGIALSNSPQLATISRATSSMFWSRFIGDIVKAARGPHEIFAVFLSIGLNVNPVY